MTSEFSLCTLMKSLLKLFLNFLIIIFFTSSPNQTDGGISSEQERKFLIWFTCSFHGKDLYLSKAQLQTPVHNGCCSMTLWHILCLKKTECAYLFQCRLQSFVTDFHHGKACNIMNNGYYVLWGIFPILFPKKITHLGLESYCLYPSSSL